MYEQREHKELWDHDIVGPMWGTLVSFEGRGVNKRFMCKFDDGTTQVLLSDDAYRHLNAETPLPDDVDSENSDADRVQAEMDDDEVSNGGAQALGSDEDAEKSGSE